MNIPTKEELKQLIETCWTAAAEAKIPVGPMTFQKPDGDLATDNWGVPVLNIHRLNLIGALVANLLPKYNIIENPDKEPWRGD